MDNNKLIEKIEILQNILISRATGGESHDGLYSELRDELINEPKIKDNLPRFIRTCLDLNQFWNYIRQKYSTYKERREYIWNVFKPIIESSINEDNEINMVR